ncbi:hypothetical protein BC835DRAFT_1416891 [Cytidiella melzeri]|nr:hypothetical protein BC835DRAFT_1416891 [Cytidiella melzeri]
MARKDDLYGPALREEEDWWRMFLQEHRGWMGPKEVKELQDDKHSSYSREQQDTKKWDAQYIRDIKEQARKDVQHIRTLERLVDERDRTIAALRLEIGGLRPSNAGPGVAHTLEERIIPSHTDVPSRTMARDLRTTNMACPPRGPNAKLVKNGL